MANEHEEDVNDDDKGDDSRFENTDYDEHDWYPGERMSLPKEVKKLVERFRENRDVYCSSAYNETQARHGLIDPFLKALGWQPLTT